MRFVAHLIGGAMDGDHLEIVGTESKVFVAHPKNSDILPYTFTGRSRTIAGDEVIEREYASEDIYKLRVKV